MGSPLMIHYMYRLWIESCVANDNVKVSYFVTFMQTCVMLSFFIRNIAKLRLLLHRVLYVIYREYTAKVSKDLMHISRSYDDKRNIAILH